MAAALLALPLVASAQSTEDAVLAFSEARFDDSRAMFTAVAASGAASTADLAEAHRYLAALGLLFGQPASARAHADAAVALQPRVTAPEGAPEQTSALFARASADRGSSTMELVIELPLEPVAGAPVHARVELVGAPEILSGPIDLRCRGAGPESVATSSSGAVEMEVATRGLEPGDIVSCGARARTSGGALLRESRRTVALRAIEADRPVVPATPSGGSSSTWIWVGAGAAVVATAVVIGLLAASSGGEINLGRPQVEGF